MNTNGLQDKLVFVVALHVVVLVCERRYISFSASRNLKGES